MVFKALEDLALACLLNMSRHPCFLLFTLALLLYETPLFAYSSHG